MKTFTILGAGWLGIKLAENLIANYKVKLSFRNEEKLNKYNELGFLSYILNEYNFSFLDELLNTDYLLISYPPSKFDDYLGFLKNIYNNQNIRNIKKIIFISSTSIYPNTDGFFDENFFIENPSNKIVFDAEFFIANKTNLVFRVSALLGEDRIAGFRLSNRIVDFPESKINFVHRNDVINAIIFSINYDLNGIFNLCSFQHPTKRELYSFNSKKYSFIEPIFSNETKFINRLIDGRKIEELGFKYKYSDAFNF